jgi:aerobic carbon-monoxide dehydrogenase large subunit
LVSAALDALAPLGITDLDMPLTPEQLWRRIREARGKSSNGPRLTGAAAHTSQ